MIPRHGYGWNSSRLLDVQCSECGSGFQTHHNTELYCDPICKKDGERRKARERNRRKRARDASKRLSDE